MRFWDFIQYIVDIEAYHEAKAKRDEALLKAGIGVGL